MPTRNVSLTDELDGFLQTRVDSGRYEEAKVEALRRAIDEGDQSGIAEGDVFTEVRSVLGLSAGAL